MTVDCHGTPVIVDCAPSTGRPLALRAPEPVNDLTKVREAVGLLGYSFTHGGWVRTDEGVRASVVKVWTARKGAR